VPTTTDLSIYRQRQAPSTYSTHIQPLTSKHTAPCRCLQPQTYKYTDSGRLPPGIIRCCCTAPGTCLQPQTYKYTAPGTCLQYNHILINIQHLAHAYNHRLINIQHRARAYNHRLINTQHQARVYNHRLTPQTRFLSTVFFPTFLHLPPLRFHCAGGCWDN
jgi:hypothetical protein